MSSCTIPLDEEEEEEERRQVVGLGNSYKAMPVVIPEQEAGRQQQGQQQQQQQQSNGQRKSFARERLPEEVECEEIAKDLLGASQMKGEKKIRALFGKSSCLL